MDDKTKVNLIMSLVMVLTVLITIIVLYVVTRKMTAKQKLASRSEGRVLLGLRVVCPKCGEEMEQGYAFCSRGLFWRREGESFDMFSGALWKSLPNTVNWSLKRRENVAWACKECSMILIDHSMLVG